MKKYLFSLVILVCCSHAMALDPFSVYRVNAPRSCVDKDIGKAALGLAELIEIGICNNPTLNRGYMEVKTYEAAYGQSHSEYLPSVTVTGGLDDSYVKTESQKSLKNDPYNANIALSWLIYDFGGRSARAERAKAYLEATQFTYNALLHDTVLAINNAYFDLLSSQEVLKSAKASEASFKKSYEESAKRYELGLVSLSDKLLAKTSYEQSRMDVVQAQNIVQVNQGKLATLLNISPSAEFKLAKPKKDKDITKLETGKMTVEDMIDLALKIRPEIKSKQKDVDAARNNIGVVESQALPSLSLGAKGGYDDDWKYSNSYQYGSSIGVNLSVPLFTGFSDTYNIAQARYQYNQAKFNETETEDKVKNEVWTAYHSYQTAVSSYDISRKALESAVENERVAFASYQIGQGDILNLLTASSQLASARKEVIVAYYSVLTSKASLYRAIGRF